MLYNFGLMISALEKRINRCICSKVPSALSQKTSVFPNTMGKQTDHVACLRQSSPPGFHELKLVSFVARYCSTCISTNANHLLALCSCKVFLKDKRHYPYSY